MVGAVTPNADPVDTAWRIHGAVADWTGKVDSKASFALAIESAVAVAVIQLAAGDRRLGHLSGFWEVGCFALGMSILVLSILCVGWAVRPRLRRKSLSCERTDFIYFGHLRLWDATDLETALVERDPLPVLSRQLVNMAKIAWEKHMAVQLSLGGAAVGTALIAIAAWLSG